VYSNYSPFSLILDSSNFYGVNVGSNIYCFGISGNRTTAGYISLTNMNFQTGGDSLGFLYAEKNFVITIQNLNYGFANGNSKIGLITLIDSNILLILNSYFYSVSGDVIWLRSEQNNTVLIQNSNLINFGYAHLGHNNNYSIYNSILNITYYAIEADQSNEIILEQSQITVIGPSNFITMNSLNLLMLKNLQFSFFYNNVYLVFNSGHPNGIILSNHGY